MVFFSLQIQIHPFITLFQSISTQNDRRVNLIGWKIWRTKWLLWLFMRIWWSRELVSMFRKGGRWCLPDNGCHFMVGNGAHFNSTSWKIPSHPLPSPLPLHWWTWWWLSRSKRHLLYPISNYKKRARPL